MLRALQISDFVIVDRLELEFGEGFGALTGETGAGKSILVDALSLVLGARGDASLVRVGRERAEICAEFDLPPEPMLLAWLDEQGLAMEEGGLLMRRVIDQGGRSRAWINGSAATLAQLRTLGERLADIHGQHAHHALLRADAQRELLDAFAEAGTAARELREAYAQWRDAHERRVAAEADAARLVRERERLEWTVEELRALAYSDPEWHEINLEQSRLAHAAGLLEGAHAVRISLSEREPALVDELERAALKLSELAAYDGQLGDYAELLQSAAIQASEAANGLGRYTERLELDPARLAEIDARIAQITGAARKHRVAPEDLPGLLAEAERELEVARAAGDVAELARREAQLRATYLALASALSARRRDAAARLGGEVSEAMQTLAMVGGRFEVALVSEPEGGPHGLEAVDFQVAASAGQPLRPLAKVASGGELSRIGLAIQVIASSRGTTPTLVFDEVDVGIGGRVAEIVGQLLRRLGVERQVLCVTHLPQVAAQADWQWSIAKEDLAGETISRVHRLDPDQRVEEIARMLGGVQITRTTREHASEMLAQRG